MQRAGEIFVQDLLEMIRQMSEHFGHLDHLLVLDELGDSVSRFSEKDYSLILNEVSSTIKGMSGVRYAFVVRTPGDTVLGMLYEKMARGIDILSCSTFSTSSAARFWLLN